MERSPSGGGKSPLSEKEVAEVKRLREQIRDISGSSKLADRIVKGLVSSFKPDDDSPDAFDHLIEFLTWLYVEDFKAEKLAAKFKSVTKTNKVNEDSMKRFINHCYPLLNARHRKEEVSIIMETLSKDLAEFTADTSQTFKDLTKLYAMINTVHSILAKHKSFSFDTIDTGRRAAFTCFIILHEKTACNLLTEHIIKNGLDGSQAYKDLNTRKIEEVRIMLQDVSPLNLASMSDGLNKKKDP